MFKPINNVIKVLIASDVLLITGFGFISPIIAIFISQKITLGDASEAAKIAGFAMAIYWGVKSFLEIPIGNYLDKNHGEKDDLIFAMIGNSLAAISAFLYIFSNQPWHIYLLEIIYSAGMAMNIPAWTAMFTRHIDKGQEAFEWASRSTFIGIGAAAAGALGGLIASNFGFNFLFVTVGVFSLFSSLVLFLILKAVSPRDKVTPRTPEVKTFQEPYLPKE
ncbi:MAG: MFS transporter [Candidatus Pacebacteria bacterium]|nr:MFS transporter [Candidatus Paceibacterota bacterium]